MSRRRPSHRRGRPVWRAWRGWLRGPGAVHLGAALFLAVLVLSCGGSDGRAADGPQSAGRQLAAQKGCAGCHTSNGRPSVGPTWKGIFGSTVTLKDGSTVLVDEAYLERSIRDPSAQIVDGFSVAMPRIPLRDDEVATLVEYIRSLS